MGACRPHMARMTKQNTNRRRQGMPSKEQILEFIQTSDTPAGKREIAKAFGLKGQEKITLKKRLKDMAEEGLIDGKRTAYHRMGGVPKVTVLKVVAIEDGEVIAEPENWAPDSKEKPPRLVVRETTKMAALKRGDRILARNEETSDGWRATPMKKLPARTEGMMGVVEFDGAGKPWLAPVDKRVRESAPIGDLGEAQEGELVLAERMGKSARAKVEVVEVIGDPLAPKAFSLIAIAKHGIPHVFSSETIAEAERVVDLPLSPDHREDLRDIPIVAIDPADARDHDDAIWAEPDGKGGYRAIIAIADVSYYVRPGGELDREARKRGNSTYFPDRVVPMLPDRLSGDLCSLHEGVPRACLAVRMVVDEFGEKIGHRFVRGLMKSPASLNYEEVQAAMDGQPNEKVAPLIEDVIHPLFAAYDALKTARAKRQPLDLDLPERRIELSEEGTVTSVAFKDRLDAHKLIEEFMVLANVAAAETLIAKRQPHLLRVHEEPNQDKLTALRETAQASGFTLAKGQVLQTRHLNSLLNAAEGTEFDELINMATLRSMTQAYYSPQNFGHFGLALKAYAHFTSPIRRYADLVVHRALITVHGWGEDGLSAQEVERLEDTAKHISDTERRSMMAERDTNDRYLAAYLSDRVGATFTGRISGIARFGVFVKLDETGADGLLPMRALGREYFHHDAEAQTLTGADSGMVIGLGARVQVKLAEAVPVTGGLVLELVEIEGKTVKPGKGRHRGAPPRRKAGQAKAKSAKVKKKLRRKKG